MPSYTVEAGPMSLSLPAYTAQRRKQLSTKFSRWDMPGQHFASTLSRG